MGGPERRCPACGTPVADAMSRWCAACGGPIERRSADRPPPSVWRRRRIGLIIGAVVGAVVIGGSVALLVTQTPRANTSSDGWRDPGTVVVDGQGVGDPAGYGPRTPG